MEISVFVLVFVFVISISYDNGLSSEIDRCPNELIRDVFLRTHDEYCYRFVDTEMYWTHARDACASSNGHHVVINDSDTQTFLLESMDQLKWTNNGVWIGLYESDGQWKWVTGETVSWSNWDNSEPNNGGLFREDCGLLWRKDAKWHDYPCERLNWRYRSVCQYDMDPATTHPPSGVNGSRNSMTEIQHRPENNETNFDQGKMNSTSDPTVVGKNIKEELSPGFGLIAGIVVGAVCFMLIILLVVFLYCKKNNRRRKSSTMFENVTYSAGNDSREARSNPTVSYQNIQTNSGRYEDYPGNVAMSSPEMQSEQYGSADYATPTKRQYTDDTERDGDAYLTPYSSSGCTENNTERTDNLKPSEASYYEEPKHVNHYDVIDLPKRKESLDPNNSREDPQNIQPSYVNINVQNKI